MEKERRAVTSKFLGKVSVLPYQKFGHILIKMPEIN